MAQATYGQQDPTDTGSQFNAISFICSQILGRIATATLVKVVSCTNSGTADPPKTVDVIPLVNQIDGAGNATPHGTIYNVPYCRLQAGNNAVIMDPQAGDIGLVVMCLSDISTVKTTQDQANPGSRRRFDWSDAVYVCSLLGKSAPTQFVRFSAEGIAVKSTAKITLTDGAGKEASLNNDGTGTLTGNWTCQGNFVVTGTSNLQGQVTGNAGASFTNDVTAAGKSVSTHDHNVVNVQGGGSTITTTTPL